MRLPGIHLRESNGALDADRQYALWLHATADLPYACDTTLAQVRHAAQDAARHPGSRLCAEDWRGDIVGYASALPPIRSNGLGTVVPIEFPWTWPYHPAIEQALHEQLLKAAPRIFRKENPGAAVHRFRESWTHQRSFMANHGWYEHTRRPILARRVTDERPPPGALTLVGPSSLGVVSDLVARDHCHASHPTVPDMQRRLASGEWSAETFWVCGDEGTFALVVRRPWAEVKLFAALPGHEETVLAWMQAAAAVHGATDLCFTICPEQQCQTDRARRMGFEQVDTDVCVAADL